MPCTCMEAYAVFLDATCKRADPFSEGPRGGRRGQGGAATPSAGLPPGEACGNPKSRATGHPKTPSHFGPESRGLAGH